MVRSWTRALTCPGTDRLWVMTARRPVTFLVALSLSTATLACERIRASLAGDSAVALSAVPSPTVDTAPPTPDSAPAAPTAAPVVSLQAARAETTAEVDAPVGKESGDRPATFPLDTALLLESVEAFASRNLYLHWAPHRTDDGDDPICIDPGEGGYSLNVAWGLATARVRHVSFADSTGARASAELDVIRVLTIEGDPETSGSHYGAEDMMRIAPVNDVIVLLLRRRRDGRWIPCDLFARRAVGDPISLIGSSVDREAPRGRRINRFVPEGASWLRADALADSIERSRMD
jgi:hypothetical protein